MFLTVSTYLFVTCSFLFKLVYICHSHTIDYSVKVISSIPPFANNNTRPEITRSKQEFFHQHRVMMKSSIQLRWGSKVAIKIIIIICKYFIENFNLPPQCLNSIITSKVNDWEKKMSMSRYSNQGGNTEQHGFSLFLKVSNLWSDD